MEQAGDGRRVVQLHPPALLRKGGAWHGAVWPGEARFGAARHGSQWLLLVTVSGWVRLPPPVIPKGSDQGLARMGKARLGKAGWGKARAPMEQ